MNLPKEILATLVFTSVLSCAEDRRLIMHENKPSDSSQEKASSTDSLKNDTNRVKQKEPYYCPPCGKG